MLLHCSSHNERNSVCIINSLLSLLFLLFFSLNTYSNELNFKHIGLNQGLSNSTIECIFQDDKGFIWIGTRDGLNKYDGYQILVYKNKTNDQTSLSDNFIKYIYQDLNKNIWIGTSSGLNKFNPDQNNFSRHLFKSKQATFQHQNISAILEDKNNNLWIGTIGNGLILLDLHSNKNRKSAKQIAGLSDSVVNSIYKDENENLWIATNKGLDYLDVLKNKITKINHFKSLNIKTIKADKEGKLWLGSEDSGLYSYQISSKESTHYKQEYLSKNSIGSNLIRAITIDKNNHVWIGCINGGLNKLDPKTGIFNNYKYEAGNLSSLSQRTVSALLEDKQGNLWIGTHRGGLNLYSPEAEKFNIIQQKQTANSLSYNDVKSFYEDKNGLIWIGTDGGGLNLYNRDTKEFKHYRYSPFNQKTIGSDAVLDIMADSKDEIYTSTWGGGLNLYIKQSNTFKRFVHDPLNPNSISSDFVQKTFEDSKNNFWVGTYYGGLNLFDRKTQKFYPFKNGKDKKNAIQGNNIISIIEDKDNNLWIGTDDGGLNCYHLESGKITHYFTENEKLPDLRVLFIDSKNRLWVGQKGLYLFDSKQNKFVLHLADNYLSEEFIKGILEDDEGYLWISTSNGLNKYHPESKTIKKYNTADGLQSIEFESNAFLKTKDGEMFFGGVNGINHFYPKNIRINAYIPPIYITELQIFNEIIHVGTKNSPLKSDINTITEIKLNYKQSTFSLGFSALNYVASENNKYAYMLVGLDEDWNIIDKNRRAYYTNLRAGEYTFKVRASNNDEVWNEEGTSLKIIITPPFWETWWFKSTILLSVLYLAFIILNFRRKLEIRSLEERKKEEMHQIQLQFFTNISHEFRTPLSLILGPIDRLLKEDSSVTFTNLYKTIHKNAYRLLSLINELMDFRKVESGALKLKVMPININSFIDEIAEEFTEMAAEKNINFEVLKVYEHANVWCDKQILEKILLNLVNNSVKYTPINGKIILEISHKLETVNPLLINELEIKSDFKAINYIYIKIADNGIGISKDSIQHLFERYYRITESHMGSGIGLAFVKSLTLLHKGKILVHSERNVGTEIIIALPKDKANYENDEIWIQNSNTGGTRLESITHTEVFNHGDKLEIDIEQNTESDTTLEYQFKNILIVDDNDELRSFLKDTLKDNYIISEAVNGEEGLDMAKKTSPDLIISDVMMPKINGIEFCKNLKEDLEISHIPFLMLTAKDSIDAEIEGIKSGADFYFSKPINIDLLYLTIKNIFEHQHKLKEHYIKNYHVEAKELVKNQKDKEFLDKMISIISENLINSDLDIEFLCLEMGISRTKLYQKIKTISGQSIGEFIRTIRLRKAIEIMSHEDVLLTEVMYRVGIQTQSYFTKVFKKEFGKTPSQFLQEINKRKGNS